MRAEIEALLEIVRAVAAGGPVVAGALIGAGALLVVLGFRTYRPCAALVSSLCAAGALSGAYHLLHFALPATLPLTMAALALTTFALALVAPAPVLIASLGAMGTYAGLQAAHGQSPDQLPLDLGVGLAIGVLPPAFFYGNLPALIPPAVAGGLVSLGAWALFGIRHSDALAFRLPAPWVLAATVVAMCSHALEGPRMLRARQQQLDRDAEQQKKARDS
jgi:hypothetical protein